MNKSTLSDWPSPTVNKRMQGYPGAADISFWASDDQGRENCIFDCPEQRYTSPNKIFFNIISVLPFEMIIETGPPAIIFNYKLITLFSHKQ